MVFGTWVVKNGDLRTGTDCKPQLGCSYTNFERLIPKYTSGSFVNILGPQRYPSGITTDMNIYSWSNLGSIEQVHSSELLARF